MTQSWHDVLFAHWRVRASALRRAVPKDFELDLFDGDAWLGIVPFHMTNVAPRATPALPWLSEFPELNVRTYVRVDDRPGVYFFSLDAGRSAAVVAAHTLLNLPYYAADMTVAHHRGAVRYASTRLTPEAPTFEATYRPVGDPFVADDNSLDYFLTERYCLYAQHHDGTPYRLNIHHLPWQLHEARATITANTMAEANGLSIEGDPALLHFSRRQDMVAWAPESIRE